MNILITGAWTNGVLYQSRFEEMGHQVRFLLNEKDELPCEYSWVEAIIGNGIFLSHSIEKFKNLRYIQLTSAGYDRVPLDYIQRNHIEIYNARGVYSVPMAEFVVAGVLSLYKQLRYFGKNQEKHLWEKNRGILELYGKTVCIVGCGSVGTECAKRFQAFGCHVIGVDVAVREDEFYEEIVELKQLNTMLEEADIVIFTLPLTEETRHLIDAKRLSALKSNAILANIARGAIIDQEALLGEVDRLGGVVLDVFEQEPLDEQNPLWEKENVLITPHNSFVGEGNQKRLDEVILRNIER